MSIWGSPRRPGSEKQRLDLNGCYNKTCKTKSQEKQLELRTQAMYSVNESRLETKKKRSTRDGGKVLDDILELER